MKQNSALKEKTNTGPERKKLKHAEEEIENVLPYDEYVENNPIELYKEVDVSIEDVLSLNVWTR